MLEDLDRLMEEAGIDWVVARGYPKHSSDVFFLTGGARVGHTTVLKRRGEPPFCLVGSMERDEARRAGLRFAVPNDYGAHELTGLDLTPVELGARLLTRVLEKHEVAGRVAFVGSGGFTYEMPLMRRVLAARPEIEVVEELDRPVIGRARELKGDDEVERIRSVGRRTEEVCLEVRALLRSCAVGAGAGLVRPDGTPLKIGHVKDLVRQELARRNLDDHGETIFACGREAGFPHSRGDEDAPVRANRPIIFDIFPQEKGGGYYFDMTRTWWVGEVADATREAWEAVREAFERTAAAARPGARGYDLDDLACEVLERRGYPTKRSNPKTEVGYAHGLGHGVGLDIHERPALSRREGNRDVLAPGQVFTIEPGLYFPDKEIGVRIEDTFVLNVDGLCESLATFPIDPHIDPEIPPSEA